MDIMKSEELGRIKMLVVGVGGGGTNAVSRMIGNIKNADYLGIDTQNKSLSDYDDSQKILLGKEKEKFWGAGGDPHIAEKAAKYKNDEISQKLQGYDLVFITAGMGGGTGTGAAPVVAEIARKLGILTIGIVTKPFAFEGKTRMRQAEEGINNLFPKLDSLIVISNDKLRTLGAKIKIINAFEEADSVLSNAVRCISDMINNHEYINTDFADVMAVLRKAGYAHIGIGESNGYEKAAKAAEMAMTNPILDISIREAKNILFCMTAPPEISLEDVEKAAEIIRSESDGNANIIWSMSFDDSMKDSVRITLIATGGTEDSDISSSD